MSGDTKTLVIVLSETRGHIPGGLKEIGMIILGTM